MINIGLITVLYNSSNVLEDFCRCLNAQTYRHFEVCFIQNDKDEKSIEIIKNIALFKYQIKVNKDNVGVAKANNQGIDTFLSKLDISHILFINNDVEFDSTFLDQHVVMLEKFKVDTLVPKIFYYGTNKIWYAGGKLSYGLKARRHFGNGSRDILNRNDIYKINYAPTCSLLINKKLLENKSIRMHEELFVYFDDHEFCNDLRKKNIQLYYTPKITLQHKIGNSSGGNQSDFSKYYKTRNLFYLIRKNKNWRILFIPLYIIAFLLKNKKIELKGIKDSFKIQGISY